MSPNNGLLRPLTGIACAAAGLGISEILAVLFGPAADPVTAVGAEIIELTPGSVKEWAIQTFGTADKLFLVMAVILTVADIAAFAGISEARRRPVGSAVITAGGVLGCAAILLRPEATPVDFIPTAIGVAVAVITLRMLTTRQTTRGSTSTVENTDTTRRMWLTALGLLGLGAVGASSGILLSRRAHSVAGERAVTATPSAAVRAPLVPTEVQPPGVALPTFITPTTDFYRIDTALVVPQLSRADWRLRVHGMVNREITYSFDDLRAFPLVEKAVTLTCVSNPVGGDLISTAMWTGYRVRDLLAAAGIHPEADMVLSTSIDGFTAGTPVGALTDGRDSLLAVGMNGEPLPISHGYPARLVVPGLYGYVSATKWVIDLELTRFDKAQAFWTGLGWSAHGPIKTQSRIDIPRNGQRIRSGPTTFGGVAWAQGRGIRAVEVRIDDGDWRPARLGASYSNDTWRLWSYQWDAASEGTHTVTARATDNTGAVQTSEEAPPSPAGATGLPTITFEVS